MGLHLVNSPNAADNPVLRFNDGSFARPTYIARGDFWIQPVAKHNFELTFEHRAQGGVFRPPQSPTPITFGLVLNVMYENITAAYDNGRRIVINHRRSVLDTVDANSAPFVHNPVERTRLYISPIEQPNGQIDFIELREDIIPAETFIYGDQGLGRMVEGASYTPAPRQRFTLKFEDFPRMAIKRHYGRDRLLEVHQILVFKFWVVAMPMGRVLATSPEYTLGAWMQTGNPGALRSIVPAPTYFPWGLPGGHRRVFRSRSEVAAAARRYRGPREPRSGLRGRPPVLRGPTANDRFFDSLRNENILPPRADPRLLGR